MDGSLSYWTAWSTSEWYGIGLGGLLATWILYRLAAKMSRLLIINVSFSFFRHLSYPKEIGRMTLRGDVTRLQLLVLVMFVSSNIVCMALKVKSLTQLSSRTALLSLVNLIPLFAGSRLSLAADTLGVSLRTQNRMHTLLGLVSGLQALIHSGISIADRSFTTWNEFTISGFTVSTPAGRGHVSLK